MKFLVDAQLPRRLAERLREQGHDAAHTLDLPAANRTKDVEIQRLSLEEQRVVVTKDSDFVDSFVLSGKPWKLLWVTTGNIQNRELLAIFDGFAGQWESVFATAFYVEMTRSELIVHR